MCFGLTHKEKQHSWSLWKPLGNGPWPPIASQANLCALIRLPLTVNDPYHFLLPFPLDLAPVQNQQPDLSFSTLAMKRSMSLLSYSKVKRLLHIIQLHLSTKVVEI